MKEEFIRATRDAMDRRIREIKRAMNRRVLYDLMGWELPEDGWRSIFRGAEGGRD